jgi:ATP-binding cassette subfamily F protein uup
VGTETPDTGEVVRSDNLQVAYFEQQRESLDPSLTVNDSLCPGGDHVDVRGTRVHISGYLSRFLFRADHAKLKVGQLSGGEQSRLALARLMLRPANVLVLDEPTNDLDMATLGVLEESLQSFDGAVLLVTHDRYFLDRATTQLLAFSDDPDRAGQVTPLVGLSQWEAWHAAEEDAVAERTAREKPVATKTEAPAPRKKLSYKDQRDLETIETRIALAEAKVVALHEEQASPAIASDAARLVALSAEIAAAQADVDALYARWSELEALRG